MCHLEFRGGLGAEDIRREGSDMSTYVTQLLVEAHTADLTRRAQLAGQARDGRSSRRRTGRLRTSAARRLLAVAVRLDSRLLPTPAPAARSATGS
jgi:hypothetical protein